EGGFGLAVCDWLVVVGLGGVATPGSAAEDDLAKLTHVRFVDQSSGHGADDLARLGKARGPVIDPDRRCSGEEFGLDLHRGGAPAATAHEVCSWPHDGGGEQRRRRI